MEVNFDRLRSELIEHWASESSMAAYATTLEQRPAEPETVEGEVVTNEDDGEDKDDEWRESH